MLELLAASVVPSSGPELGRARAPALEGPPCARDSSATSGGAASASGRTGGEAPPCGVVPVVPFMDVVPDSSGVFCTEGRTAFSIRFCKTRTRRSRSTPRIGIEVYRQVRSSGVLPQAEVESCDRKDEYRRLRVAALWPGFEADPAPEVRP